MAGSVFDLDVLWPRFPAKPIEDAIDVERMLEIVGEESRDALTTSPVWPVLTGFSKANFDYLLRGLDLRIVNRADYAAVVEERTGAARATLDAALPNILKGIGEEIEEQVNS